jgi:hypothetical protein
MMKKRRNFARLSLNKNREALVKDMLSDSLDTDKIDQQQFTIYPDDKRPLDSVVENTNNRKNFMEI